MNSGKVIKYECIYYIYIIYVYNMYVYPTLYGVIIIRQGIKATGSWAMFIVGKYQYSSGGEACIKY